MNIKIVAFHIPKVMIGFSSGAIATQLTHWFCTRPLKIILRNSMKGSKYINKVRKKRKRPSFNIFPISIHGSSRWM
jgi:hypothetical protein